MIPRGLDELEVRVLELFAHGRSTEQIGGVVKLHKGEVQHLLRVVARKLGANNQVHAVAIAAELGIIRTVKRSY